MYDQKSGIVFLFTAWNPGYVTNRVFRRLRLMCLEQIVSEVNLSYQVYLETNSVQSVAKLGKKNKLTDDQSHRCFIFLFILIFMSNRVAEYYLLG